MALKVLLHPVYFPNIATFSILVNDQVVWEHADNYQKQTYRNRCHICTDQGLYKLTIPIKHTGSIEGRQKYKDVKVDHEYDWQKQHWRTLQTAYRTSPFFEFYEDELAYIFQNKETFLIDFNLKTISFLSDCLSIDMQKAKTTAYEKQPKELIDGRCLVNAKSDINIRQDKYTQVFGDRHGFLSNLSTLDLLFNEGPNAKNYLQNSHFNIAEIL